MSARVWLAAAAIAVAGTGASAQSLAQRVGAVRDGTVHLSFAARPDVCGDGEGSVWVQTGDNASRNWQRPCIHGPVHVRLGRSEGTTVSVRTCIACRRASETTGDVDLGDVSPVEAAKYLLAVARESGARNAGDAVSAAALADAGDLSPDFSRLIRDETATLNARKQALFWLGQTAESTRELVGLYDALKPLDLREHYTFVLSKRRDDEALAKLMDVARHDPDFKVRKQAMFWLGQSKDPKAVQFFKDILTR